MTRIEILNIRLGELEITKESIDKTIKDLYTEKQEKQTAILKEWFEGGLDDRDTYVKLKFNPTSFELFDVDGDDTRWSYASFYIQDKWNKKKEYTDIEVRISSESYKSVSERLISRSTQIVCYSQTALDFKDDILAEFNQLEEEYDGNTSELQKSLWEIKKSIDQQQSDIAKLKKEELTSKLTAEGIELDGNKNKGGFYLPSFEFKRNSITHGVKAIKVLKMSVSGKTVDLELKKRDWNGEIYTTIKERVRMDNVISFLNKNKELIA